MSQIVNDLSLAYAIPGPKRVIVEIDGIRIITDGDPSYPPLSERQGDAWQAIKERRDAIKEGGVNVGGKWFHSDDSSRIQQLGLVLLGANIPSGLQWKTMDGSFVAMTQALAGQIFAAVAALDVAAFSNAESHRLAMLQSAAPEIYDFSSGWPVVYA